MGSSPPLDRSQHILSVDRTAPARTAHCCRSPIGRVLRCSFPKADIGKVAQHLGWSDGGTVGRSGLLHVQLLLAQHFFVSATASIFRCSVFQQSRHREDQNQVHPDHPLPGRRSDYQVAKFAVITAPDAKGRPRVRTH